jgi:hypothetical protein
MEQKAVRAVSMGHFQPACGRIFSGISTANRSDLTFAATAKKARKLAASYGIEPSLVIRKATPAELEKYFGKGDKK